MGRRARNDPAFLTIPAYARRNGQSPHTWRKLARADAFPVYKIGTRLYLKVSEGDSYIRACRIRVTPPQQQHAARVVEARLAHERQGQRNAAGERQPTASLKESTHERRQPL